MPESTTPSPKPNPIILRPATSHDAPQIAQLGSAVFSTAFGYSLPASDLSDYLSSAYSPSSISNDIANPNSTVIVACPKVNEELVVGFSQLTEGTHEPCVKGEKPVELQRLYVSTEWAGKGIGKLLIERIVELAKERGKKTIWLGVVSLPISRRFFLGGTFGTELLIF
jgi:GNAT superfamily N-acetyltransferase